MIIFLFFLYFLFTVCIVCSFCFLCLFSRCVCFYADSVWLYHRFFSERTFQRFLVFICLLCSRSMPLHYTLQWSWVLLYYCYSTLSACVIQGSCSCSGQFDSPLQQSLDWETIAKQFEGNLLLFLDMPSVIITIGH